MDIRRGPLCSRNIALNHFFCTELKFFVGAEVLWCYLLFIMPVCDGIIWQRAHPEEGVHVVKISGERFRTKEKAVMMENEYKKRKWSCRHILEESPCMTFEEALQEERKALEVLQTRFPKAMFADLCRKIHHASCNEQETNRIANSVEGIFYEGESVCVVDGKKSFKGVLLPCPATNKMNDSLYNIQSNDALGEIVNGLPASALRRCCPITKRDVDVFFLLVAHKKGSCWILDEDLRRKYSIPNKIHSLFIDPSAKDTNYTWPTTCESFDVVKKHSPFSEDTNCRNSSTLLKCETRSQRSDDIRSEKKRSFQCLEEGSPESKKVKIENGAENDCSGSRSRQNDCKKEPAAPKSKLMDSVTFVKPMNSDSESSSIQERYAKRVDLVMRRLTNALINHDLIKFHQICSTAATTIPLLAIQSVDNSVIRYAIEKRYNRWKQLHKLNRPTAGGSEDGSKKEDPMMEKKLRKLLDKKLDDLLVPATKSLPQLPRAEQGTVIANRQEFAGCLFISEFLHTFRNFLFLKEAISAEELGAAVHSGEKGFMTVTGHLLVLLIRAIFSEYKDKNEEHVYQSDMYTLPVTVGTVSELCRLVFSRRNRSMKEVALEGIQDSPPDASPLSLDVLRERPFYALAPLDQLNLFMILIGIVAEMQSFRAYMELIRVKIRAVAEELKAVEKQIRMTCDALLQKLKGRSEQYGDRADTRTKCDLEKDLQDAKEKQLALQEKINELKKIKRAFRHRELGFDRFHRKYWFYDSCNQGIYVERGWWALVKAKKLHSSRKTDAADATMSKGSILTVEDFMTSPLSSPSGIESNDWYKIQDVALLRKVCAALLKNGSRESKLLEAIQSRWDDIVTSIKKIPKKQVSDEEKVVEKLKDGRSFETKESDGVIIAEVVHHLVDVVVKDYEKKDIKVSPCNGIDSKDGIAESETELGFFKRELIDFHEALCENLFLSADNCDIFRAQVDTATSLNVLKEVTLEVVGSMPQFRRKKTSSEKTGGPFSLEKWKAEVHRTKTISRLNLLLHILNLNMDWAKNLVKADDSDRMLSENNESDNVDSELVRLINDIKVDRRIYRSLLAVPPLRRSRRCGRSIPLSLKSIEKNLHKYHTLQDLKDDLRMFLDSSLRLYENNQRKYSAVMRLKEELNL